MFNLLMLLLLVGCYVFAYLVVVWVGYLLVVGCYRLLFRGVFALFVDFGLVCCLCLVACCLSACCCLDWCSVSCYLPRL